MKARPDGDLSRMAAPAESRIRQHQQAHGHAESFDVRRRTDRIDWSPGARGVPMISPMAHSPAPTAYSSAMRDALRRRACRREAASSRFPGCRRSVSARGVRSFSGAASFVMVAYTLESTGVTARSPAGTHRRAAIDLPLQFLEIHDDRPVRTQQIGEDLVARAPAAIGSATIFEKRPEPVANRGRQDAFQILERRAAQVLVVGMQSTERNLQRLARQDQREQREDMRQALAGPIPHEFVDKRHGLRRVERVEQPTAFPDRAGRRQLPAARGRRRAPCRSAP